MRTFSHSWAKSNGLYVAQKLGLTTNLELVLDAGDAASFTSGDKWLDLSGNGYDFYRGSSASGDAAEPTFNGTAGGLSSAEYFSTDGADYFLYDAANEVWMENIHKNNAAFTLLTVVYDPDFTANSAFAGDSNGNINVNGFDWMSRPTELIRFRIGVNGGVAALDTTSTATMNINAWNIVAISINEASGTGFHFINGAVDTFTSTYSSPASGAATTTLSLLRSGAGAQVMQADGRMPLFMGWSRSLSQNEMLAVFQAMRGRYGI